MNIQFPDKDDGSQVGGQGPALLWPGVCSLLGSFQFLSLSSTRMFTVVLGSLALRHVLRGCSILSCSEGQGLGVGVSVSSFCFESPFLCWHFRSGRLSAC